MKELIKVPGKVAANFVGGPKSTACGIGLLLMQGYNSYIYGEPINWDIVVISGTMIGVIGPK